MIDYWRWRRCGTIGGQTRRRQERERATEGRGPPSAPGVHGLPELAGLLDLYPPQAAAVDAGLLEGRNLLIASPTASGKTFIAALAAYKRIVEEHRKVVYLSPLRALASEKYSEFKKLLEPFGVRCAISTGDFDSAGEALRNYDLLVLTNEKFDSLLRHGIPWLRRRGALHRRTRCTSRGAATGGRRWR